MNKFKRYFFYWPFLILFFIWQIGFLTSCLCTGSGNGSLINTYLTSANHKDIAKEKLDNTHYKIAEPVLLEIINRVWLRWFTPDIVNKPAEKGSLIDQMRKSDSLDKNDFDSFLTDYRSVNKKNNFCRVDWIAEEITEGKKYSSSIEPEVFYQPKNLASSYTSLSANLRYYYHIGVEDNPEDKKQSTWVLDVKVSKLPIKNEVKKVLYKKTNYENNNYLFDMSNSDKVKDVKFDFISLNKTQKPCFLK